MEMANVEFGVSIIGVSKVSFYHLFRPRSHCSSLSLETIYYDLETDSYSVDMDCYYELNYYKTYIVNNKITTGCFIPFDRNLTGLT